MRGSSYLGAYLQRQRSGLGAPKAITATAHKLARIVSHLVKNGESSVRQEEEKYAGEVKARMESPLRWRANELGDEVVKWPDKAEETASEAASRQAASPPPTVSA